MVEDLLSFTHDRRATASPEFLEAAQQLAQAVGLDADMVAQGRPMVMSGLTFRLHHDVDADPTATLLMVEIGVLPPGQEERACRRLLELHYLGDCESDGTYCLLPGTRTVVCSVRRTFATTTDFAQSVLSFVEEKAAQKRLAFAAFN